MSINWCRVSRSNAAEALFEVVHDALADTVDSLMLTKVAEQSDGALLCLICGSSIMSKGMRRHMWNTHILAGSRFVCPICHRVSASENGLRLHMSRNHGQPKGLNYSQFMVKE
jgi:hypothetical protein